MKIYLTIILTATLAACQATIPELPTRVNQQNLISNEIKKDISNFKTLIEKPVEIENDNNKPGEYPQQYQYIIANKIQSKPTVLFKPIPYITSKKINGWGVCYLNYANNTDYYLAIIKNNVIIETFTSPEIAKTCEDLKQKQLPIEENRHNVLQEETIKNFSTLVDDPEKFYLFGEPPKIPIQIIRNQLNFFLEDPQSAEINNVSVRKTFLISQDKVIYCYLVFVDLKTKDIIQGKYRESKKAIFYMKDDKILDHKIFSNFNSGLKPKKGFDKPELIEDNQDNSLVRQTYTIPYITKNIKPLNKKIKKKK